MRWFAALALTASFLSFTDAINLVQRDVSAPAVLGADIQRRRVLNPVARDRLRRRQTSGTLQETLNNEQTLYFASASLGTPAQQLRLHLDTGSSDLWANSATSPLCRQSGDLCADSGTYDANKSSTYQYVNSLFNISYVDGSGATGDYAKDTFHFGGQDLTGMQFGIGYESSSPEDILGIGYPINEVAVNRFNLDPYPNLPQLLVNKGIIQAPAYSLWLNDLDASTGSILFGGVDTGKYHGSLASVPIIKEYNNYQEFVIGLTGLSIGGKSVLDGNQVPVLLDSGSSLMYLPNAATQNIYDQFNVRYSQDQGAAIVDCALADQSTTLDFAFGSQTISVPMNELVLVAGYSRRKNAPICILGIGPADGTTAVLGDTFLRSAYVVYDLQNNEISLAATNFNSTTTNILEIMSGSDGVPDATGVVNAVASAAVTGGGGARIHGQPSVTSTGGAPMPTAVGYGVMAAAGAGLLFAL